MEDVMKQLQEINQAMGEAGGIAFCELWGISTDEDGIKHPVRINVTARDLTSISALRQLMETIKIAREEYKLKPYQPNSGYVSKPVQEEPKPATNRPAPKVEGQMFHCNKIMAGPFKDKIKLDWYTDSVAGKTKYPFMTSYIPVEQAMAWLQPFGEWEADDFYANKEYPVSLNITWAESDKKNDKGNPYKNIVKIEAA